MTLTELAAQRLDDAPSWLKEPRRAGAQQLETQDMPSPKDEVWRYVELGFDLASYAPATEAGPAMAEGPYLKALAARAGSATMVDGYVTATGSTGDVIVTPADSEQANSVQARWGTRLNPARDIFTAAHAAFSPGGVAVHVPKNVAVADPIVIDSQSVTPGAATFPHVTVMLERNSELSVVIVYSSPPAVDLVQVPHVEAFVEDGGRLRITTVQVLGTGARSVGTEEIVAERDAAVRLGEIGLGGAYARLRLGVQLAGAGSSFNGAGLYFGDGDQVHDYRVFITHTGPRSSSDLFLKGAVEDTAQAVWTGLVRIEHGAVGTSAFETNRNLVLSEGARVNSVPNLEILTDDLQCGHGSSSGPLDEEHLYYLMSRGMRRERAERLLIRGFFEEIITSLPESQTLADPTRTAVYQKFVAAQEAGRVL